MSHTASLEKIILEQLNTAVLFFDAKLNLKYLNPAAEMLLAISAKYLIGQTAQKLFSNQLSERIANAVATRQPYIEREIELFTADGNTKTINCIILPLHSCEINYIAQDGILLELTQIDHQLRIHREEQLLTQHQLIQSLLRNLAHEIKNPLGGMRGAAQLLEREFPNLELLEHTKIIIDEADRLQNLMNRMLGPGQLLQRELVNIHDVLEHVRGLILAEFPQGPQVRRDYDPSIPLLQGDADRLIQAFLNLARNAATAAGANGYIELRTRVLRQCTIANHLYRLVLSAQVRDNGSGIPVELRERIFFPMVSGHPGGTGLGLPIAQKCIQQHGGLIECTSRPGNTIFCVYLPLELEYDQ